ncbi:MAG: hypothetical protein H6726_01790 [Sandaracinaceae bacterium]|nr:hypothetical protein [Myxococcales bacterium]MCB9656352.1 hypothetical protein [Sandaracinaceae bacterium]
MGPLLSAALLAAALAPWFEARAWRVPLRYVPLARMARTFLSTLVLTGLAGGAFWLVLVQAGAEARLTVLTAAALAWATGVTLALLAARRDRGLRGLHVLCAQLGLPDRRDDAATRIDERLTRDRGRDPRQHALLVLFAAGPLTRHGLVGLSRKHLAQADEAQLAPPEAALRAHLVAMSHLHDGALEAALEALDAAPYPTTEAVDAWVDLTRALVHVLCGGVEQARALRSRRRDEAEADPALRLQADTVEAHALSAEGDDEGAKALVRAMLERSGAGALALLLRPVGPATDLAREAVGRHLAGSVGDVGGADSLPSA